MALKVYRARSMQDALAEVKRDLGPEAMILNTRSYRSRGLLGLGGRPIVEITATADANPRTRPAAPTDRATVRAEPKPLAGAALPPAAAKAYGMPRAQPAPSRSARPEPVAVASDAVLNDDPPPMPSRDAGLGGPAAEPLGSIAVPSVRAAGSRAAVVEDDLKSIKRMVSQLMQTSARSAAGGALSDPLFEQHLRLQENAVAAEIADEIVGRVRDELSPPELADEAVVRETMLREIAAIMPAADPVGTRQPIDGRPHTVALIGPTGVGKTTTVAKLAARAKLRRGRSVGLITTDTYRIAAVEQLRTYAEIIGLPLKVVGSASEMRPAIETLEGLDEIYIDTAGRSQHDAERLTELRTFLDEADPHETHLVLSSVASESVLLRAADNFGRLRPNRIIFTKLDEAVETGVLLGVIRRVGVAISYVTNGQEVPDHIEPGNADRLARRILGGEGKPR